MNQRRVSRLEVHAIPLDAATSLVFSRLDETVVRPQWCNITTPTNSCQATEKGPSSLSPLPSPVSVLPYSDVLPERLPISNGLEHAAELPLMLMPNPACSNTRPGPIQ